METQEEMESQKQIKLFAVFKKILQKRVRLVIWQQVISVDTKESMTSFFLII